MEPAPANPDLRLQLDALVRREHGRLIAQLLAWLGGSRLDLAEDMAQEALLTAMSVWPYRGMPDNPRAWLARVARNRAIDRLRREHREVVYEEIPAPHGSDPDDQLFASRISDPELRLMLLCCHPALTEFDRLALTLRVVSGFTAREIASVFLVTDSAMGQRLARARRKLKALGEAADEEPSVFGIRQRADTLLKCVYLVFSLAYAPRSGEELVRSEIAFEALRLARELAQHELTRSPQAQALTALLCFQASRLNARQDEQGTPILLRNQDRAHWDRGLIMEGFNHLAAARAGQGVSRYHLEAGIASVHAAAPSWEECDWDSILRQYEILQAMTGSPVVIINACIARAMSGEAETALTQLDELEGVPLLKNYSPYFIARAEVLSQLGRKSEAAASYGQAIKSGISQPVGRYLAEKIQLLEASLA
ncbi:MAG TPA: sigma-70 family RNA polymerase sigma factor [Xanthomonadales bacterium]|nr:sigma-70 family RNA polymerase sigma factor [Xanthomonadales bacterium]